MREITTRTLTFVFSDLEGSTRLWEQHRAAMPAALARHDSILEEAVLGAGGNVVKGLGDGVLAVFAHPVDAIEAAFAAQRALAVELWSELDPLRVRMGIHTGPVEERGGDFFGPVLNRAARLMSVGHGGQVLVSNATAELVRDSLPGDLTLVDLGEVRLRDLSRSERVWQLAASGLDGSFPPLRTSIGGVGLPEPRTSLVGRDDAVHSCVARLAEVRLLTLTGVGGSGKTRLAIAVAGAAAEQFADGVWFVDLSPVADPALVAAAVTVGLHMHGARDPETDLGAYLNRRSTLIVLDNCEHVLDECASLVDAILAGAPKVRIVATSREPLGVEGEHTYRVPSLVPEVDGVRLFEDRARAVRPEFTIDEMTRPIVAEACRRLDGVPLAIELAAAQIEAFAPEQIVAMIDERFTLLTGGRRRGRQATLAAVMDWSYQLLSREEQGALARASTMPGSFVLDAFAAVIGSSRSAALVLLRSLVSKSLVNLELDATDARYRLLETVRLYGESKLSDAEATSARDNLVSWVRETLSEAEFSLRMAFAEREVEAIRAALSWALARGDNQALVEITILAAPGWSNALLVDVRHWLAVVEGLDATLSPAERCAWRARRANASAAFGDLDVLRWADEALAYSDDLAWEPALSALHMRIIANNFLDPHAARRDLDRALQRHDAPSFLRAGIALTDCTNCIMLGDAAEAQARSVRAEALADELGEIWAVRLTRLRRADALELQGRSDDALAQAMIAAEDRTTPWHWVDHLVIEKTLTISLASLGRVDEARDHLGQTLAAVHDEYAHIPNAAGPAVVAAGAIALAQGNPELALTLFYGAIKTLIAVRDEICWDLATRSIKRLRAQLDPVIATETIAMARAMTPPDLVAAAEAIAFG